MAETFTLVSTVKDEAPYLWEWVAYHRMIGFNDILIFQNDSTDGKHDILTEMARHNFVKYKYNKAERGTHQVRAYKRATKQPEYQSADWIMALDLDEFLLIHTGNGTLPALIAAMPAFDCAYINWARFGSAGLTQLQTGLVTETFTRGQDKQIVATGLEAFKSLFRRNAFARPGVHRPLAAPSGFADLRVVNGSGLELAEFEYRKFRCSDPGVMKLAQVNHYIVKDAAHFVLKSAKGSAHQANRAINKNYWKKRNRNQVEDMQLAAMAPRIKTEMAKMDQIAKGKLSELTQRAQDHHRHAFKALLNEPWAAKLYAFCAENHG